LTWGDLGDIQRGDENVQRLIDANIMKQWTEGPDQTRICSYRTLTVQKEEGVRVQGETNKVCFV